MPIEIREMVIIASVRDESDRATPSKVAAKAKAADASHEEQLIKRCVEQVMEILQMKSER